MYSDLTKEEACEKEIELIKQYDATNYKYGYNISQGGELRMSKPVKKYNLKGELIAQYPSLVEASDIEKIDSYLIKACCLGKTNSTNGYIWRYIDDDFNKYIQTPLRVTESGKVFVSVRNDDYLKPIYKYNKNGKLICTYKTVYDIPTLTTRECANIIRCCRMDIKTSLGFVWRFNIDNNVSDYVKRKQPTSRKKIVQYDTKGNIVKIWNSISDASEKYHTNNIQLVLSGKRHLAKGFVWRYYGDPFDKYPIEHKKSSKPRKYDNMPVCQYDRDGNYIHTYSSVYEIDKDTFHQGNVIKCLFNEISHTKGYVFKFKEEEKNYCA